MACEEWRRFVEDYRKAVQAYGEAVSALDHGEGGDFNYAWQRAEKARKRSDGARAALLNHEHDHACLLVPQGVGAYASTDLITDDLILGDQGQSGG